jgi:uncharacterized protein YjbJ (UPF0337 family)
MAAPLLTSCPEVFAMNKDEMEGKAEKAKGWVKDKAGEVTGNPDLEAEGEAERATGAAKEKFGEARRTAGEAAEDVARKIKGE